MTAKEKLKQEIKLSWDMLQFYKSMHNDDSKDVCMWRHIWYAYCDAFKIVYGEEYNHD